MHEAWVGFLKGNAPAAAGLPAWPRFSAATRSTMLFNAPSRVEQHPAEAEVKLWAGVL
jgi:para-nitrobenzyl esterase